jgi:hypothetical protein
MNIVSPFSYTIETVIQAGKKHLAVASVPIRTNPKTRSSRLFKSIPQFVTNSLATLVRMYSMYQPLRAFFVLSALLITVGLFPVVRFLYFYLSGDGGGHIQSLILGGVFLVIGFLTGMIGLVADLISFNRQLLEITLEKVRRLELRGCDDLHTSSGQSLDRPAGHTSLERAVPNAKQATVAARVRHALSE